MSVFVFIIIALIVHKGSWLFPYWLGKSIRYGFWSTFILMALIDIFIDFEPYRILLCGSLLLTGFYYFGFTHMSEEEKEAELREFYVQHRNIIDDGSNDPDISPQSTQEGNSYPQDPTDSRSEYPDMRSQSTQEDTNERRNEDAQRDSYKKTLLHEMQDIENDIRQLKEKIDDLEYQIDRDLDELSRIDEMNDVTDSMRINNLKSIISYNRGQIDSCRNEIERKRSELRWRENQYNNL